MKQSLNQLKPQQSKSIVTSNFIRNRKQNASERINLQHIMELREAFDIADTDKGGALEIDEFIEAFGEIIGKNMNPK